MARKKLEKIAGFKTFPNAFDGSEHLPPNWSRSYFGNEHPMTLELACGWGEYTLALAKLFPHRNFIGVDIKGVRLWKGARLAVENNLSNAAFLRCYIDEIGAYFTENSVEGIWITFPDPHPKKSKANKRLTSPRFLNLYRQILKSNGLVHLKTDNEVLFDFTVQTLKKENFQIVELFENLDQEIRTETALAITTKYEKKYIEQNKAIKYLCFRFD